MSFPILLNFLYPFPCVSKYHDDRHPTNAGHRLSRAVVEEAPAKAEPWEVMTQPNTPPPPHIWVSMAIFLEDSPWEEERAIRREQPQCPICGRWRREQMRPVYWPGVPAVTVTFAGATGRFCFHLDGAAPINSQVSTKLWKTTSKIKPPLRADINNTQRTHKLHLRVRSHCK